MKGPEGTKDKAGKRGLRVIEGGGVPASDSTKEPVPPPAKPDEPIEGKKKAPVSEARQMLDALGKIATHGPYTDAKEGPDKK